MRRSHEQHLAQSQKQIQRLILSPQMQQALHLLQLPVLELSTVIEEEMSQNPLLEYSDLESESSDEFENLLDLAKELRGSSSTPSSSEEDDTKLFLENSLTYEITLYDHLLSQVRETFLDQQQRAVAELLVGYFDGQGFLTTSLEEICLLHNLEITLIESILERIQTFDPPGIGARDLRESLLIQMHLRGSEASPAFRIIRDHFDEMLRNRIPQIAKALGCKSGEVRELIEGEIRQLDLHPAASFDGGHRKERARVITPDVRIIQEKEQLSIEVNQTSVPSLRVNPTYLGMLRDPTLTPETREYIQEKLSSSKWLMRNLQERHHTLHRIAEEIAKKQQAFFCSPDGQLTPLTMKAVAEELGLHESTVARAVANKYLTSPRGIFPLRYFFSHAYITDDGQEMSSKTVKDLLVELIRDESPKKPLSDEALSALIRDKGIPCARRTVAKYRQELGIGNTIQRRKYD